MRMTEERDFVVVLRRGGEEIDVTEAVQAAYDVARGSMDFGSGFLDTEEVVSLRTLGEALGAEPFEYGSDKCDGCGHERDEHQTALVYWDGSKREAGCFPRGGYHRKDQHKCPCKGFLGFHEPN
jgi:hypothetical protein